MKNEWNKRLCSPEAVHFKAPRLWLYPVPLTAREDTRTLWEYSYFPGNALWLMNREDITVYAGTGERQAEQLWSLVSV